MVFEHGGMQMILNSRRIRSYCTRLESPSREMKCNFLQNPPDSARYTSDGSWLKRSRLEFARTGGIIGVAADWCSMTRSAKLGTASTLLLGSIFVPPFSNWREPLSVAFAVVSCVLALLAAQQGSKWWLAIPCAVVIGSGVGWYLAAHSF